VGSWIRSRSSFAGGGFDDSDVDVVDEDQDAGSGVGFADADVVQAAGDAQGDGAGLVDAVGADAVVSVGAGAEVSIGSGLVDRGGGGAVSGGRRRCSTVRSPPQDTITQLAECLLRQADRYRPGEFGIHESDGAPDEKEGRPKHAPPDYQACMMRGEMWPRRQESISRLTQAHRAVPS
jgi:hypothetical protein